MCFQIPIGVLRQNASNNFDHIISVAHILITAIFQRFSVVVRALVELVFDLAEQGRSLVVMTRLHFVMMIVVGFILSNRSVAETRST